MAAPFPLAGELSATASSLLWAVAGVLFVRIRPPVSAVALNLGKNVVAVLCFAATVFLTSGTPWPTGLTAEGFVLLALSGLVGLAFCDSLLFRAFLEIGPRRSNLYMASSPPLVAGLALLPPFSEFPSAVVLAGMAVCLAGLVLAVLERSPDPVREAQLRRGARDALLAAFLQAAGLLLARRGLQVSEVSVAGGATIRLAFGTLGLLGMGLVAGRLGTWRRELARGRAWRHVAVAAFLGTFLGIWTNQAGLAWSEHTGVAATLNSLAPVFLIPLSAAFLGERHDARTWISTVLAVVGVAGMTML